MGEDQRPVPFTVGGRRGVNTSGVTQIKMFHSTQQLGKSLGCRTHRVSTGVSTGVQNIVRVKVKV